MFHEEVFNQVICREAEKMEGMPGLNEVALPIISISSLWPARGFEL